MTVAITTDARALGARIDAALAARARVADVPLRERIAALARAAARWRDDAALRPALVDASGLSCPMIDAVVPLAAGALDAAAMTALVEDELGAGAADRPAPAGPALVTHVLASNVPALALPAIALGVLAGAAVVVKSGRDDAVSAPAFVDALAAEAPALAATVVAARWPGGPAALDETALARADVAVLTGGDAALAALAARARGRLVLHGPRWSVVAVGRAADPAAVADAVAVDTALHDQRGCLSPHAVYVEDGLDAHDLATRVVAALEALRERLPPPSARVEERAAVRVAWDTAALAPGAQALGGPGAGVVLGDAEPFRPGPGGRTLRAQRIGDLRHLPALLPAGTVECVGFAGADPDALRDALRARGVARLCPAGRMQRPPLSWPRGQQRPLAALLGRPGAPAIAVER